MKKVLSILLAIILVFTSCSSSKLEQSSSSKPEQSSYSKPEQSSYSKPEKQESQNWVKAGTHKVGADIPAGEYYIKANSYCYIAVTTDSTGSLESIVTNDNISTFTFVTVKEGQYLEITNGEAILASEIPPIEERGEGTYRVGIDIPSGEYKIKSTSALGYVAVLSDTTGALNAIVTNDNFEGEKYITVADGQYLQLVGVEIVG